MFMGLSQMLHASQLLRSDESDVEISRKRKLLEKR